jgi:hypothetical protein
VSGGPDPFAFLAVPCRRCGAPTTVWSRVDDTAPILVCVTHGGVRDCPGKQPLPPAVLALWQQLHPDAGPVERARLRRVLLEAGISAAQLDRPRRGRPADPEDDDVDAATSADASRQLPLF